MPRLCTICSHPNRNAIEAEIEQGTAFRVITEQHHIALGALSRHKSSHMVVAQPDRQAEQHSPKRNKLAFSSPEKRTRKPGMHLTNAERQETQAVFLDAFRATWTVSEACDIASINPAMIAYWQEHDTAEDGFGVRYHQAKEYVNDMLRKEAYRRATKGTESYVVNQGKLVMTHDDATGKDVPLVEHKYSDTLLMFMMKARMPEFREKQQVDVTSNGQTVGQQMSLDQFTALQATLKEEMAAWRATRGFLSADDL